MAAILSVLFVLKGHREGKTVVAFLKSGAGPDKGAEGSLKEGHMKVKGMGFELAGRALLVSFGVEKREEKTKALTLLDTLLARLRPTVIPVFLALPLCLPMSLSYPSERKGGR